MKKLPLNLHFSTILIFLVLALSTVFKVLEVSGANFAFTMDQGRDLVDIRHMVVTHTPRLVGPTTSINGVLLGPAWYYFNLVPFIVFGGNPSAIVLWQIFWYQLSGIILWLVLKKQSRALAFTFAALYLLMPVGFNTARYFWNANSMVFFTALFVAAFLWVLQSPKVSRLALLGLVSGIAMQIEAAFGIILFPFAFVYLLAQKTKIKKLLYLTGGFVVTLIPQALFELRHGFVMTKIFLNEFTGKGEMLGEKTTFAQRLSQRAEHFIDLLRNSNHIPEQVLFVIFAAAFIYLAFTYYKKSLSKIHRQFFLLSTSFILFSALFYLAFPQKLKIWYTLGLSVPIIALLSTAVSSFLSEKLILKRWIAVIFIFFTFYYTSSAQIFYLKNFAYVKPSQDPSNLKNELNALDWVYQQAEGKGFKVYSYLPSVYDYPYNYLFWWYGASKYGYQPADTAYLPNQPEYIKDSDRLWSQKKDATDLVFLVIEKDGEKPDREQAWLGNFSTLCEVKKENFPWRVEVKMLSVCKK